MLTMVFKPFQNTIYVDACRLGVELLVSLDVSKGFKPKTSIQLISQHIVNIYTIILVVCSNEHLDVQNIYIYVFST